MTKNHIEVYQIILNSKGGITVGDIAKKFYKGVRKDMLPKNPNNSILSFIYQMQKTSVKIKTFNRGCKGVLVTLT